jgi:GntR family transcriptional repressor for pyruvate dehydrogenase complex
MAELSDPLFRDDRREESKVDKVVSYVLAMVRDGRLKKGDRLPPERTLAEELKMSRAVIREALSALQISGYVERRPGDGTFLSVSEEELETTSSSRVPVSMSLVDALELRMDLEIAAVVLACRRARPSDVLRMEAIIIAMREYLDEENYEGYLDASMDLHLSIGRASHSAPLQISQSRNTEKARCDQWLLAERYNPKIAERSIAEHEAIVEGIRQRDVNAATDAVWQHYNEYPTVVNEEQEAE